MGYMAGTYESKTFYSFSHTLESVIHALAKSNLRILSFRESDEDISSLFPHLSRQGLLVSGILVAKKQ